MDHPYNPPKICIVGAGVSGICAAVQLQKQLDLDTFTIFDENEDVGGNWLVNTYPGCQCDVPSHLYSFSFEPNPNWSKAYSGQEEILEYLKNVANKHDIYSKIKFKHKITNLKWDPISNKWNVTLVNKQISPETEIVCDFDIIIGGFGALRIPNRPEKFNAFRGPTMHSAEWDPSIQLENKTVAVIGSGASAVQIIPQIAPKVGKLLVYQRNPAWVMPLLQMEFSSTAKWIFSNVPGTQWALRNLIFWYNEINHSVFKKDSYLSRVAKSIAKSHLNGQVKCSELRKKLTPNYTFGCKRVTPSNEYYPALARENVTVITSNILEVTKDSITTEDGKIEKPEVLILATGFRVQDLFAPLKITGRDGVDVLRKWKEFGPNMYAGIVSSDTPNFFYLLGPNTGLGHNSAIFSIECQVNFAVSCIKEMITRKLQVVAIKKEVEDKFIAKLQDSMKSTVWWSNQCGSWYANDKGLVTAIWPGTSVAYWNVTKSVNFNNFEFN